MSVDSMHDGSSTPATIRELSLHLQDLEAALYRAHHALDATRIEAEILYCRSQDLEGDLRDLNEQHRRDRQQIADAHEQIAKAQDNLTQALSAAAAERTRRDSEVLLLRNHLDEARLAGTNTLELLRDVLSSRSWVWTRPFRKLMEWSRGRRWSEPRVPPLPSWISEESHPGAADEDGRLGKKVTETKV